jgi:hypothetical protein
MTNPALAGDVQVAFGAWLRRQREERGIPVGEIADLTRLPAGRITALEDGRWDVFGATTYVRGAVRAYSTAIGLDADATLLKLEADGLGDGVAEPWAGLTDRNNPLFREGAPKPDIDSGGPNPRTRRHACGSGPAAGLGPDDGPGCGCDARRGRAAADSPAAHSGA